ncbi:hypothetical protein [Loktanella sp. Alg231-35]|uniref:hypothetical protein n=1 Tax=Loktanella sp. Alg231-35 TaxID=1922220 RepID=UPI000D556155|nr:hypothetical protein [Loktanella sp. Alg231-35]
MEFTSVIEKQPNKIQELPTILRSIAQIATDAMLLRRIAKRYPALGEFVSSDICMMMTHRLFLSCDHA